MSGVADGVGALRLFWDGKDSGGNATKSGLYFVSASTSEGHVSHKLAVLQ
jgi:hypothetical protein